MRSTEAMRGLEAGPIRIRVGIHTGEPGLDPPKYVGLDVHLAARMMSAGHGGQVLLSQVDTGAGRGRRLTDLGEHRLKDIDEPVSLYQLGDAAFPPLKTISNTNLPRPASSFRRPRAGGGGAGRAACRERTPGHLDRPGRDRQDASCDRGGARELVGEFKAGVFWVGLAALHDPALVARHDRADARGEAGPCRRTSASGRCCSCSTTWSR